MVQSTRKALYEQNDFERFGPVASKHNDGRDAFRRDLSRIIHCPAFRRLQGKTQLFPGTESDFFRTRLTHSLEVAQIATGIALNLNASQKELKKDKINEHLVHLAALAHDIGHPPFGHNGEKELDKQMEYDGGFEGNAQTIRILCRLEKKETLSFPYVSNIPKIVGEDGSDQRIGLNLTFRSLASVLKYDSCIPDNDQHVRDRKSLKRPVKGYYQDEKEIIKQIKQKVAPGYNGDKFKTLECSIMDLADDIAYSTYDLEDAFKAGFLSPLSMAASTADFKNEIVQEVNEKLESEYKGEAKGNELTIEEINNVLKNMFVDLWKQDKSTDSYSGSSEIHFQSQLLCSN